jgi:glycosyltransferase involved in cell wall biosynthesis
MCAGLPVVSSLKGTLAELLAGHDCGVTYENGSPEELAGILCDLYDHPERLAAMSKNARALYEERFVAEKVYGQMSEYLEEIAAAHRSGALGKRTSREGSAP